MTLNDRDLEKVDSISDKFCCFYMYIDEEDADKSESELQSILKTKKRNKTIHKLKVQSKVATTFEMKEETPVLEQVMVQNEEEEEEELKGEFLSKNTIYKEGFRRPTNELSMKDSMDVSEEMKRIMGKSDNTAEVETKAFSQKPVEMEEIVNSEIFANSTKLIDKVNHFNMQKKVTKKVPSELPKKKIVQVRNSNKRNQMEFFPKLTILLN